MKRIDPGQKNSWSLRVLGMKGGVEFCTRYPKTLRVMTVADGEQVWQEVAMGSQSSFATSTGGIFEFGFSDAIQQMWGSYLAERRSAGRSLRLCDAARGRDQPPGFAAAWDSWGRSAAVELP